MSLRRARGGVGRSVSMARTGHRGRAGHPWAAVWPPGHDGRAAPVGMGRAGLWVPGRHRHVNGVPGDPHRSRPAGPRDVPLGRSGGPHRSRPLGPCGVRRGRTPYLLVRGLVGPAADRAPWGADGDAISGQHRRSRIPEASAHGNGGARAVAPRCCASRGLVAQPPPRHRGGWADPGTPLLPGRFRLPLVSGRDPAGTEATCSESDGRSSSCSSWVSPWWCGPA